MTDVADPQIFFLDVAEIRQRTGLTQKRFAQTFGFTVNQVETWERGTNRPNRATELYLRCIDADISPRSLARK